jgi:hypothetical protein
VIGPVLAPPHLDREETDPMRVMVIVKATRSSEAGVMPSEKLLADMGTAQEARLLAEVERRQRS